MSVSTDKVDELERRLEEARQYLRVDELRRRRPQLETEMARPDLWDEPERARAIQTEFSAVSADLDRFDELEARLGDVSTALELTSEEPDEALEREIGESVAAMESALTELELRSLFSGEHDEADAVCELHSGEGGTDAQDWCEMLLRMYLRWAERHGFETEIDEVTPGTEAGVSSATFIVKGRYAFGMLRGERGTHRLVRISPFNAQGKRQTAFSALSAVPLLEETDSEIEIDPKELRVDVYRSSGAGGQHVNKTDSAVRLTHIPTGTVVSCQNERSQHQNRDRAMTILKAKLADLERQKRAEELDRLGGTKDRVGFGTQIRSYVMHPYQQVKDLRSNFEVGMVDGVLDGDLDRFMEAFLRWERAGPAAN